MTKEISRKFTFGKYKGELIIEVIRMKPWYIEWLLKRVQWFKLNKEEEEFYNQTVKDWYEAWNNVRYAFKTGSGAAKEMYKTVEAYKKGEIKPKNKSIDIISAINNKFSNYIEDDDYSEIDDICLGSDPMALF